MHGDERMRFCNQCALHVYNISAMSSEEAEALIMKTEGRLCIRMLQRKDGTVITEDCPKALQRIQRRMKVMAGAMASALAVMAGLGVTRDECPAGMMGDGAAPARHSVTFTQHVPMPLPVKQQPHKIEPGNIGTSGVVATMGGPMVPSDARRLVGRMTPRTPEVREIKGGIRMTPTGSADPLLGSVE